MTDPTGQLVFALTAAGVLGTVAEATPNKVRQVWVFRVWDSDCGNPQPGKGAMGVLVRSPQVYWNIHDKSIGCFYQNCNSF